MSKQKNATTFVRVHRDIPYKLAGEVVDKHKLDLYVPARPRDHDSGKDGMFELGYNLRTYYIVHISLHARLLSVHVNEKE